MKKDERYEKLMHLLSGDDFSVKDAEKMADSVLSRINAPGDIQLTRKLINSLFFWSEIRWMRTGFASAFLGILAFLVVENASLNRKMESLQKQIIPSEYNFYNLPCQQASVFETSEISLPDSILVSGRDLMQLLRAYRALELNCSNRDVTTTNRQEIMPVHSSI